MNSDRNHKMIKDRNVEFASASHQAAQKRGLLTVDVHLAVLGVLDVVLLRHDDGLDVFHGQVIAERLVKETLQLVHGELLHVAL